MENNLESSVVQSKWSERILVVSLPPEPQIGAQISNVITFAGRRPNCDMILDLARVDTLMEPSLRRLLEVRRLLSRHGHRLVLCNASESTVNKLIYRNLEQVLPVAKTSEIALLAPSTQRAEGLLIISDSDQDGQRQERRKCVRIRVPNTLRIDVLVWDSTKPSIPAPEQCRRGRLVDLSDSGAQVVMDRRSAEGLVPDEVFCMRFACAGDVGKAVFDVAVRESQHTADGANRSLGLEFIGLDTNPSNKRALRQLYDYQTLFYEASRSA